jgi:hypothetical protein
MEIADRMERKIMRMSEAVLKPQGLKLVHSCGENNEKIKPYF